MHGGPMYTLLRGLGWKHLAVMFAAFSTIAAFGIGNMVQSNAISMLCEESFGVSPVLSAAVVSVCAALVLLGGVKGIARICSAFVPFMALLYIVGCLYILCVNWEFLWPSVGLIFESAFSTRSVGGGFVGSGIMMAARYGIARGLFSNESGLGSAPIVAAAAQTKSPVRQALVSSTGTFWDTVVMCALTGLVIVSSVLANDGISFEMGGRLTHAAFATIPYVGTPLLLFGIITFAFSTILGWEYYGEKGVEFLAGRRSAVPYRVVYVVLCFVGGITQLELVWNLSDLGNGLMAIPNLVSVLALSGVIARESIRPGSMEM